MKKKFSQFSKTVLTYYDQHGRHDLPWRKNQTAYRVLVSEYMLQQTQASRVEGFFLNWMKQFPSWKSLANAPQSEVLLAWKGLGYNSRALRLQKVARIVVDEYKGRLPADYTQLISLPGIGPYTAGAILAFAFNVYQPIIETNIRRVFIHHFFKGRTDVSDAEIMSLIQEMGVIEEPRKWYEALMDYGSHLPKVSGTNANQQSKHYKKQKSFKGSDREIRGKILDILLDKRSLRTEELYQMLGEEKERYEKILGDLQSEGFCEMKKKIVTIS